MFDGLVHWRVHAMIHRARPFLVSAALAVAGCAAPQSDQGQGGSTGSAPLVTINIGTGGGITTTNTSAPTAAPASSASAAQTATNDVKPTVGTDAIKAATPAGALPTLGTPLPAPEPAPVEPPR